jgi:apolipoprotein D and lipocalin family protein
MLFFPTLRPLPVLILGAVLLGGGWLCWQQAARARQPEQVLVEKLDLDRYLGRWYEIARIPNLFQPDSHLGGTDTYEQLPDGSLKVTYGWFEQSLSSAPKKLEGRIRLSGPGPGQMKVQFFWPFEADYWVLEVPEDYSYTVIGYPDRSMAWIMSRTPQMDESVYQGIVTRLKGQGYPIEKLRRIVQPEPTP